MTALTKSSAAAEHRRVAWATAIGTAIEWYDFFIYANAAALVFAQLYFSPLEGTAATLVAFATAGVSFVFRPLGAIWGGYLGDKLGRRAVLVWVCQPDSGPLRRLDPGPPAVRLQET